MNRAEVAATPSFAAPGSRAPDNRWAVLALVGGAQLMIVLDVTIVKIALPSAQVALHFSADDRQWIITAYALIFGSLLLLGGKLGDLLGRKWTFMAGLLGFAGASALGGLAPSLGVLIAARALQGAFGALLAPSALSLLTVSFHNSCCGRHPASLSPSVVDLPRTMWLICRTCSGHLADRCMTGPPRC
jgi:sugar phosphate permease